MSFLLQHGFAGEIYPIKPAALPKCWAAARTPAIAARAPPPPDVAILAVPGGSPRGGA